MRRTAVLLALASALAGLPAAAATRHAAISSALRKAEDPCGGLGRADRRACQADQRKDAKAGRALEAQAGRADPCAKLPRRRRDTCEREVEAASRAEARTSTPARRKAVTPATAAPSPAAPKPTAREMQPADLIVGLETADAKSAAPSSGAPALRGTVAASRTAVGPGSGSAPTGRGGRRAGRLHEVVLEDGQSLAELAASTGVSVADLARLNGIESADDVPTGMTLKLPAGAKPPAAPRLAERGPDAVPAPTVTAAPPRAASEPAQAAERRVASAGPSAGPRPYASLGPTGSEAGRAAPLAAGRWGRTQADAMAAYAVASARAPRVSDRPEATHDRFVWPLRTEVVSAFGAYGTGRRNDGVDLAAHAGDAVRAAAAGEVVYAGKEIAGAGGNLVLLKHADGWVTAYSHLGRLTVGMRQTVDQGQEIAEAADVAGASVHFEVRQPGAGGAKPVDPASVLPARGAGALGRGA